MTNIYFPNKIELLGETFKIKEVSKNELTCKECGEESIGNMMREEKIIHVAIDDEKNNPDEIILHELGHYYSIYYGLGEGEFPAESFGRFVKLIIKQLGYKHDKLE